MATQLNISYAAHTASCTFLLDSEGICRSIVMAPSSKRRASSRTASNCVGAQYIASLDGSAAGGLVEMPRVGAAMLFARIDKRGRVSLVRTGLLISFESRAGEDPFAESPSVETSAPVLHDLKIPRRQDDVPKPRYSDRGEPTQRIAAFAAERFDQEGDFDERASEVELATAEYRPVADSYASSARRGVAGEPLRPNAPSPSPASHASTPRKPRRDANNDNYSLPAAAAPPSRAALPRRSDPKLRAGNAAPPRSPESPHLHGSDVQLSRRRRG